MAFSKCAKCGNGYFEVAVNEPRNSNYKVMMVQCASCGSVIGAMDYYNIGTLLKELESKVKGISAVDDKLNVINQNLEIIYQQLRKNNRDK